MSPQRGRAISRSVPHIRMDFDADGSMHAIQRLDCFRLQLRPTPGAVREIIHLQQHVSPGGRQQVCHASQEIFKSIFIGVKNKIGDFAESTRKDIKIPHLFIGEALKYRLILLTESQDIITIDGATGTLKERRKDSVAEIGSMHGKRMDHFPR